MWLCSKLGKRTNFDEEKQTSPNRTANTYSHLPIGADFPPCWCIILYLKKIPKFT